jgi:hypothetical protein
MTAVHNAHPRLVEVSCHLQAEQCWSRLQAIATPLSAPLSSLCRGCRVCRPTSVNRSPCELTFDRANWKFALIDINILTLGVAHQGAAYPTVWLTLSEAGNYSTEEQITLMEIFFDLFGKERIKSLICHFGFDQAIGLLRIHCRRSLSFT